MAETPTDDLLERLKDPEYAKLYGEENAKVDFAITLTKARKNLNLSQKNLADKLGISQPYVAKLESGEANPTLGRIGSLLASIDLRLVTGTAPLKPEPMLFSAGLVLTGAIGAGDAVSILGARPPEESQWLPVTQDFVDAGTANSARRAESARFQSEEVIVGGAAR